jgi:hypothetical protein
MTALRAGPSVHVTVTSPADGRTRKLVSGKSSRSFARATSLSGGASGAAVASVRSMWLGKTFHQNSTPSERTSSRRM